jgi:hypothetical protein
MTNKKLTDMGEPIKDEIPGLRDFNANSVVGSVIRELGIPEVITDEYCAIIAQITYKIADAMMEEKYKKQTRH